MTETKAIENEQWLFFISLLGELHLLPAEKYHYLNQSGCIVDPTIDDKSDFFKVLVRVIDQSINQSVNQSVNQSINQFINVVNVG